MSKRSISSRSRPPKRRRVPFPRLPRTLITWEVAYQKRFGRPRWTGPSYDDAPPLLPEDLTRAERTRLRQRARARYPRMRTQGFRVHQHQYWLHHELALSLPGARPQTIKFWRDRIRCAISQAEQRLAEARELEALILKHKPATDAWLRRQLATLDNEGRPA